MQGYTCQICNQYHQELPRSYGAYAPVIWYTIPDHEKEQRAALSSDQCMIDDQYFFIVGNIEIPIIGSEEIFSWSVWVSLSEEIFYRAAELWEQPGRESEPPYFGWLNTVFPVYPDTLNLKAIVHTRPVGQRPYVELESTDHPLAIEQRNGVSWERVQEIASIILHKS